MKKLALLLFILAGCAGISIAQDTTKWPKLRVNSGFLSTEYELGDKDVSAKDVRLHLEKANPEAYHQWRKSESNATTGLILTLGGAIATLVGATTTESTTGAAAYITAAGLYTGALIASISSGANQKKAVSTYNKFAGY